MFQFDDVIMLHPRLSCIFGIAPFHSPHDSCKFERKLFTSKYCNSSNHIYMPGRISCMSQIMLYFLHSTSVLIFYIDVALTLSMPSLHDKLLYVDQWYSDEYSMCQFVNISVRVSDGCLLHTIYLPVIQCHFTGYDDVIQWKHFPSYWHLCGEFTGHRLKPRTMAIDTEL